MDMGAKDTNIEHQKGSDDAVNYHAPNMSSAWQINGNNLTNSSIGMIPICNSMVEFSSCSSAPMVDSFCPPIWDQSIHELPVKNDASTSSSLARADLSWTSNSMLRGGVFLPPGPAMLPHFPADSAFIERAARLSCFSGGNFGEMMNPFSAPDQLNPYSRSLEEVLGGNGSKSLHAMHLTEVPREGLKHGTEGSPFKNEKRSESYEAKQGVGVSGTESDEAEFSGRGPQDELDGAAGESSGKGLGMKKRKRGGQV